MTIILKCKRNEKPSFRDGNYVFCTCTEVDNPFSKDELTTFYVNSYWDVLHIIKEEMSEIPVIQELAFALSDKLDTQERLCLNKNWVETWMEVKGLQKHLLDWVNLG